MFPGGIGTGELLLLGVVAVLLFGSKLPDVARNFGKSYQQLKKGLSDLQSSFHSESYGSDKSNQSSRNRLAHYKDATDQDAPPAPPFEPPATPDFEKAESKDLEPSDHSAPRSGS